MTPVTTPSAPIDGRAFVGRALELAALLDGIAAVVGSGRGAGAGPRGPVEPLEPLESGRLFLVVGEPGIGKSRLVREVARRVGAEPGLEVAWGRCWESGGAPAWWPWIQVLGALVRARPEATADLTEAERERLAGLSVELREVGRGDAVAAEPEGSGGALEARFATFRAVVAFLRRATRDGPALLVLEDLHAADPSSLLLLQFIAPELASMRLVIVATYRDADARMTTDGRQALARTEAMGHVIAPRRLDEAEVAALVRLARPAASAATARAIHLVTQGNPLFVEGLVRGLEGELVDGAIVVPRGVRDAIRQQLAALPADTRAAVEVAAVMGHEVAVPIAVRASGSASIAALLEDAVAAGVLATRGSRRFVFVHELVRETLYRDLPQVRRTELHGAVADALGSEARGAEVPWAELAHHLLEAGPARLERAVAAAIAAAERALEAMAFEDALAILGRARAAVGGGDTHLRAELILAEGLALSRVDGGRSGAAACAQAAELARTIGDVGLFARAALGYGANFTFGRTDLVLVRLLEEALGALPAGDDVLRARLMARLASALQPALDPHEPVAMARAAIAMVRRVGDVAAQLAVIHAAMSALMDFVPAAERLVDNLECERLALAAGDRPRLMRVRARLAFDHLELGSLEAAERCFASHAQLAAELRFGRAAWAEPLFTAMRAAMAGRFAEAEAGLAEASARAEAAGDPERYWVLALHKLGLLRTMERHEALLALEPEVRAAFGAAPPAPTWGMLCAAGIRARAGRVEEARALLAGGDVEACFRQADLSSLGFLAEIVAVAGERALIERAYAALLPLAGRLMSYGVLAMFCEGPYDRQLGALAAALGRGDDALRHFDAALAMAERLGLEAHVPRIVFERARVVWARDPEAGRAELGRARAGAERLEQSGLVRAIVAFADGSVVGASPSPQSPQSPSSPSSSSSSSSSLGDTQIEVVRSGPDWVVRWGGPEVRLRDMRGLHILERLLANPERELHALELVAVAAGDTGDAGEVIDGAARARYRARLEDLEEAAREAEAYGDGERLARAREEIAALGAELARAVGLGGRARRAGSAVERARVTVQKRVKDVLRKIDAQSPELARRLAGAIRTGAFCAYYPGGRPP